MKWYLTTSNESNPNKGIIIQNPTFYEFDLFTGTGNDDEFSYKFFNELGGKMYDVRSQYNDLTSLQIKVFDSCFDPDSASYEYAMNHASDLVLSTHFFRLLKFQLPNIRTIYDPKIIDVGDSDLISNTAEWMATEFTKKYGDTIISIVKALVSDYNPIENYRMVEKENVGSKITVSSSNQNDVYGFNSASAVPSGKQSGSSVSTGNKSDNERDLTRSGNIGVTTSQQMIESELALRKNKMISIVFGMLDEYFGMGIYK